MNFYNDNDPSSVAWIRALIEAGLVPKGVVDGRSITELGPEDLVGHGYDHVCLFAGVCGWEYALQLARWPCERPVWTGSCPCPPFSQAGRKKCKQCGGKLGFYGVDNFGCDRCGLRDERHLWPEMRRLIALCRPATVFGEQVASKDGREWLSRVRVDLEKLGYAVGCADLCAAGASAPQIRQRLFWVADASLRRGVGRASGESRKSSRTTSAGPSGQSGRCGLSDDLAHGECAPGRPSGLPGSDVANGTEAGRFQGAGRSELHQQSEHLAGIRSNGLQRAEPTTREENSGGQRPSVFRSNGHAGDRQGQVFPAAGQLGHPIGQGLSQRPEPEDDGGTVRKQGPAAGEAGPWDDFEVIVCDDGKGCVLFRRTQSGLRPLAARLPGRMAQLRGLGNSIVPPLAAEFIRAYLEAEEYMK